MDSCTANEQMSTHPIKLKCSSSRLVHFVVAFFRCSSYAQNNMALEKIKLRQNMKYPEKTHPTNYYILSGYAFLVFMFFPNFFSWKTKRNMHISCDPSRHLLSTIRIQQSYMTIKEKQLISTSMHMYTTEIHNSTNNEKNEGWSWRYEYCTFTSSSICVTMENKIYIV